MVGQVYNHIRLFSQKHYNSLHPCSSMSEHLFTLLTCLLLEFHIFVNCFSAFDAEELSTETRVFWYCFNVFLLYQLLTSDNTLLHLSLLKALMCVFLFEIRSLGTAEDVLNILECVRYTFAT